MLTGFFLFMRNFFHKIRIDIICHFINSKHIYSLFTFIELHLSYLTGLHTLIRNRLPKSKVLFSVNFKSFFKESSGRVV